MTFEMPVTGQMAYAFLRILPWLPKCPGEIMEIDQGNDRRHCFVLMAVEELVASVAWCNRQWQNFLFL